MSSLPSQGRKDWIPNLVVWCAVILICAVFVRIVGELVWHGVELFTWDFLTTAPRMSGRAGGIAPILVSTLLVVSICLGVSIPIGVGTAVLLAEYTTGEGIFGRLVRRSLDVLAGVPSIVFGLFGNALFCQALGMGFSILSGGLTLACMVLPLLIRSTEEGLRSVPRDYRLSSAALGISRTSALFQLILPAAVPGLIVGLVLGIGRAMSETAALLFTSGYVDRMPSSVLDSGRTLAIHIFDLSMNISGGDAGAYKSTLVLLVMLFFLNTSASVIANRFFKKRIYVV